MRVRQFRNMHKNKSYLFNKIKLECIKNFVEIESETI